MGIVAKQRRILSLRMSKVTRMIRLGVNGKNRCSFFLLDCNLIDQTHGKFVKELTLVFIPLSKFEIY